MKSLRNQTAAWLCVVAAVALTACGKKNDNNSNQDNGQVKIADVPGMECVQPGHSGGYGPYQSAGFTPYPWQNAGTGYGFNACPRGTIPLCGSGSGLMCAPVYGMQNYRVAWYGYQPNQGFNLCGYTSYQGYYNGSCGGGYRGQIGRACIVGTNSCGAYARCSPLGYNGSVGVCTEW